MAVVITLAAACLIAVRVSSAARAAGPGEIPGLEAWYSAGSLSASLGSRDPVEIWKDQTANEHDLISDQDGLAAVYHASQLNGHPAVQVRKGNGYNVKEPFDLGPHTIFLVYRTATPGRALFRGGQTVGLVLRAGDHDRFQNGGTQAHLVKEYNKPASLDGYSITVLARDGTTLKSFINGEDASSNAEFPHSIRVGKFFELKHTQFSSADGNGLWIAEMMFYDRYLTDDERESVTGYLASRYGFGAPSAPPVAQPAPAPRRGGTMAGAGIAMLGTSSKIIVNEAGVAIPWNTHEYLDSPFQHDPKNESSRLTCSMDATRVRLYVSLPLTSSVDGANVRVLFYKNGGKALRGEGRSGRIGADRGSNRVSVRAEVIATLDAGDYVEVVLLNEGNPGELTIDPGALFIAEVK